MPQVPVASETEPVITLVPDTQVLDGMQDTHDKANRAIQQAQVSTAVPSPGTLLPLGSSACLRPVRESPALMPPTSGKGSIRECKPWRGSRLLFRRIVDRQAACRCDLIAFSPSAGTLLRRSLSLARRKRVLWDECGRSR